MKNKYFPFFIILILAIASVAVLFIVQNSNHTADLSPYITNITCDALTPCPEGLECIHIQDKGTLCVTKDFTENFCNNCPFGKQCMMLEMYPPSISCG